MSQSLERRIEGRQGNNAMLVGRTNLVAAQRRSWGRAIAPKATPPPSRRLDGELGFDDDCFTSNYLDGLTYTCRTGIDIRCYFSTLFSGRTSISREKAPFPVVSATDSTLGVRVFGLLTDSKTLILARQGYGAFERQESCSSEPHCRLQSPSGAPTSPKHNITYCQ